jgi:hypothetical protein
MTTSGLGWIADHLSDGEIATALNTLAEMVSEGHNADLSLRQQEVAEKIYRLWQSNDDDEQERDDLID